MNDRVLLAKQNRGLNNVKYINVGLCIAELQSNDSIILLSGYDG